MKWSDIYLKTLREKPAEASIKSHVLLLRAGYIYNTSQGIYLYNSLFVKAIQKLEKIIREEMHKQGATEILMPMVQTKELWKQSNRWDQFEGLLLKMKSRTGEQLCLAPTHEELIIDFVRSKNLLNYKNLPLNLYQIQTKYRDEIRPRFGLMRAREFIMKDAYSFDTDIQGAKKQYQKMSEGYHNIFKRLKVDFVVAQADSGAIGGNKSQEFHILASQGEDEILVSENKKTAANKEICPRFNPQDKSFTKEKKPLEEFATPGIKTIKQLADFLKVKPKSLVKILFFTNSEDLSVREQTPKVSPALQKHFAVLCRGDDNISLLKLKRHFSLKDLPALASAETIKQLTNADPGSCGPLNLNIPVYLDCTLKNHSHFITGANKPGFHVKNVSPGRDFKVQGYGDFCLAKQGDLSPTNDGILTQHRGIEVGHVFYLGNIYSKKMNLTYLNSDGKKEFVQMGCYGLGVTRTLQAIIEQNHDEYGIIWPESVSPCLIHICLIDPTNSKVLETLKKIKSALNKLNIDYFIDDRDERPGVKFKDADLLGLSFRLNLGERDLKNNFIEFLERKTGNKQKLNIKELQTILSTLIPSTQK